jgi:hypothetical protein
MNVVSLASLNMPFNVKIFPRVFQVVFLRLIYFLVEFTSFNKNFQETLPPLNIQKDFPLLNKDLSCSSDSGPSADVTFSADLNTNANAQVAIGIAVQGTVVPPKLTEMALYASKQPCDYYHPR